jgi:hypothetical protein
MEPVKHRNGIDPREPRERPPPPPRESQPPAQPTPPEGETVDREFVAGLAKDTVPDVAALQDYLTWSTESLAGLRATVLLQSGIDHSAFLEEMSDARQRIASAEADLNRKNVPQRPPAAPIPPLPGVDPSPECLSQFDANDLALGGRKAVRTKRFHVPVVFPEVILATDQRWRFGQRLDLRQEWRHEGFTLGELISSLSLLPNEELTLEVSSWQRSKTEIAEEQSTETRERMEREQRRSDEESTTNEAATSEGWSVSANGSVSYGPASASVSAEYTSSTENRAQSAQRHISEATTRAANEVSLKRAVKMTQTAEAGSEARNTRRIRNPNSCHTVTFNFFQIVKLYDVQTRLDGDAPTVMLPGLFPAVYADGTAVDIPYWAIESFTSPANFLTQFFDVDRDLSAEISGWALRVRCNSLEAPDLAVQQVVDALIVAVKYLLKLDPQAHVGTIAAVVSNYVRQARALRAGTVAGYGPGLGRSEQLTTPGIYADSLLGRCTACEDYVAASRYVDVMRLDAEREAAELQAALLELERQRRARLLEAKKLDPFEPIPGVPPGR